MVAVQLTGRGARPMSLAQQIAIRAVTWAELARRAADLAGMGTGLIHRCPGDSLGWIAPRPRYSALGRERAVLLPRLDDALSRFLPYAPSAIERGEPAAA